jgi:hypothetical protein
VLHSTKPAGIRNAVVLPSSTPGYGRVTLFTAQHLYDMSGNNLTPTTPANDDGAYRRWAITLYNNDIYYTNELNPIRRNNGSSDTAVPNAPGARYLAVWYDHLVVAYTNFAGVVTPSRLMCSDLYRFDRWQSAPDNEADHYDFVEWQQLDYPFVGITGIGKLGGTLWVYTPTALLPVRYVGMPKVIHIPEDLIVTRTGNTFPWTLVCLDKIHFFFDAIEMMFLAFDGQQVVPIGDPVRTFITENLNVDVKLASKMYGYIDVDNREVWWPFVSKDSSGTYDRAVVFNYRYKRWFTASVEDVQCFCGGLEGILSVGELTGPVSGLVGPLANSE